MNSPFPPADLRAVLFDVDGTLVDSVDGLVRGLHDAFVKFGSPETTPEQIQAMIGTPLSEQMRLACGPDAPESLIEDAMRYTLERYAVHGGTLKLFQPAVDVLVACHAAGFKTALVTSKNADEIAVFQPKFPAMHAVGTVVCASDVAQPKPAAESALLACARLGVEPSQALFVGDSIFDLRCAKSAGCAAIAVSYGAMPAERLLAEAPEAHFATPDALLAWFQSTIFNHQHEKENHPTGDSGDPARRQAASA